MSHLGIGPAPEFRHLDATDPLRARLVTLRTDVAPILANNVLHHFTDHSVSHSDSLINFVDDLIAPLQAQRHGVRLGPEELVVLYAACYLHDIGMQLEAAGATKVIQGLNLPEPWESLPEQTRRDLLRRHHPAISAEMVRASVNVRNPWVNHHITPECQPECLARVCEAHTVDVDSPLYNKLTRPEPRIRTPVVSGLLRLADILDESRRRAIPGKARTLLLDSVSQAHWWRHYYTKDVTPSESDRCIVLWFEYPAEHFDLYHEIVPRLQMPLIEAELRRHHRFFIPLNFGWWVRADERADEHRLTDAMPSSVVETMRRMLREQSGVSTPISDTMNFSAPDAGLAKDNDAAQHLLEARPYIDRQVAELERRKDSLSKPDYLLELDRLAGELWELGAKRSAWTLLSGQFDRDGNSLPPDQRLDMALRLLRMMVLDEASWHACLLTERLQDLVDGLPATHPGKRDFWILRARGMNHQCAYDRATEAYERAISLSADEEARGALRSELAEMHMLQGELGPAEGLTE